jgi:DivIVA domain-containing protein
MELTTQTLHAVEFREARRGGYNTRDVDDFIEQVAAGVGQLQERLREAMSRAEVNEARLREMQHHLDEAQRRPAPPSPASDADETLRRTLVLAQRTADATIKEAKEEANRLLADARGELERARAAAEEEARKEVSSAREKAEAEVDELLEARDALKADVDALRAHLHERRASIRAGLDELRRVVEHPDTFPAVEEPPLTDVQPAGTPDGPADDAVPADGVTTDAGQPPDARPRRYEVFATSPAADPSARNGHDGETAKTFEPGAQFAALQEPPSSAPRPPLEFRRPPVPPAAPAPTAPTSPGPPASPFGFGPDQTSDRAAPWMPPELRGSGPEPPGSQSPPGEVPPPTLPSADDFGVGLGPSGRPSEWGRAVFDDGSDGGTADDTR